MVIWKGFSSPFEAASRREFYCAVGTCMFIYIYSHSIFFRNVFIKCSVKVIDPCSYYLLETFRAWCRRTYFLVYVAGGDSSGILRGSRIGIIFFKTILRRVSRCKFTHSYNYVLFHFIFTSCNSHLLFQLQNLEKGYIYIYMNVLRAEIHIYSYQVYYFMSAI